MLKSILWGQEDAFVVLDEFLWKFFVEDALSCNDEACIGYLLLCEIDIVDFCEIFAGIEWFQSFILPNVIISSIPLIPALKIPSDVHRVRCIWFAASCSSQFWWSSSGFDRKYQQGLPIFFDCWNHDTFLSLSHVKYLINLFKIENLVFANWILQEECVYDDIGCRFV
jgi:hypothetical protein